MLATVHELRDGVPVRLRLTRPTDAPRVRAFLEHLSDETRHRRFLAAMPQVPESVVRHFTFYDPRERMIVAATAHLDGTECMLGIADIALLETGVAELAVVVADEHQGRGVGTLLSEAIASLALRNGATHLKAEMLDRNIPMLRLMEALGPVVQSVEDGNWVVYARLPRDARHAA
jgi:GNAT superfamily N-acetyltransferase